MQDYLVVKYSSSRERKPNRWSVRLSARARVDGEAFPTGYFALTEDKIQASSEFFSSPVE